MIVNVCNKAVFNFQNEYIVVDLLIGVVEAVGNKWPATMWWNMSDLHSWPAERHKPNGYTFVPVWAYVMSFSNLKNSVFLGLSIAIVVCK